MLKNLPYEISNNYEELYDYLMLFDNHFIILIKQSNDPNSFKLFKARKNNYGSITIADDTFYRKNCHSKDEFIHICNKLNISWISPFKIQK